MRRKLATGNKHNLLLFELNCRIHWLLLRIHCILICQQLIASVPLCVLSHFSHILLFVTLWTVAHQSPLSMGFSSSTHWSGLPCLSPGIFLSQGSNPCLLCLLNWLIGSLRLVPAGKPIVSESIAKWKEHFRAQILAQILVLETF